MSSKNIKTGFVTYSVSNSVTDKNRQTGLDNDIVYLHRAQCVRLSQDAISQYKYIICIYMCLNNVHWIS